MKKNLKSKINQTVNAKIMEQKVFKTGLSRGTGSQRYGYLQRMERVNVRSRTKCNRRNPTFDAEVQHPFFINYLGYA